MHALAKNLALDERTSDRLVQVLFLVYLLGECATDPRYVSLLRVGLVFLSIVGIVAPPTRRSWAYWLGVTALMSVNVVLHYDDAANHHFLTAYVAAYFTLDAAFQRQARAMPFNVPRLFLVIIFLFATLQKLLSAYFMSGRLIAAYLLEGRSLFAVLTRVYSNYAAVTDTYSNAFAAVAGGALLGTPSAPVDPPAASFIVLCRLITYAIVGGEAAVFILLAFNRTFYHPVMPWVMIAFLLGTFALRPEVFFFTLLCTLFLLSRRDLTYRWRLGFVIIAAVFLTVALAGQRNLFWQW